MEFSIESTGRIPNIKTLEFIKSIKEKRLDDEEAQQLLSRTTPDNYPLAFFILSETNKILDAPTYTKSFICRNLAHFTENDIYYIAEGIRKQIYLGFDDFYLVMDKFFQQRTLKFRPVQNLLLFLFENFDYRIREFLITTNILTAITKESEENTLFVLKIIKKLIESENPLFKSFLEELELKIDLPRLIGNQKFFFHWYNSLEKEKQTIQVNFHDST
ncbi:hypothetical protein GINT2_002201 [Glugoides intestinalis]